MKLHLGCGQVYLDGYVNIDFPLSKHSVQTKTVADEFHDITKLSYKKNSINEIRLHHVFEHFSRPQALGLLVAWRSWLKDDGVVRIEVPDFDKTAIQIFNPLKSKKLKYTALRHIFGSQEADWAVHYEGWSENRLDDLFKALGFDVVDSKRNNWKGTYNIDLAAKVNNRTKLTKKSLETRSVDFLKQYLVDETKSEMRLLETWIKIYQKQVDQCWAKK